MSLFLNARLTNSALQYLLNLATPESFDGAAAMVVNARKLPLRPHLWSASLARAYLATKDMNLLTGILFATTSLTGDIPARATESPDGVALPPERQRDRDLFSSLVYIYENGRK